MHIADYLRFTHTYRREIRIYKISTIRYQWWIQRRDMEQTCLSEYFWINYLCFKIFYLITDNFITLIYIGIIS